MLAGSAPVSADDRIDASALIELRSATSLLGHGQQTLQVLAEPRLKLALPYGMALTGIGRLRADAFDELEPGDPPQTEIAPQSEWLVVGDRTELELRELYVDAGVGRTTVRLGKQQIVWGQADGLKVLDVVNPQDFREFILQDLEASRIPLWSAKIEVPIAYLVAQFVWIPDETYHRLPTPRALYEFRSPIVRPQPPPGVAVDSEPLKRPSRFVKDSDVGGRLLAFARGWDLTLNYLYHYDDVPVPFSHVTVTDGGPQVTLTPRYERTHLTGGTYSNAFGDLTLRGEIAYFTKKYFLTADPADADGVVGTADLEHVVGLDWYVTPETLISGQIFQSWTPGETRLTRDELETNLTLLVRKQSFNDRLVAEVLCIQNTNRGDGLVRPKVTYQLRANLGISIGLDVFYGTEGGLFGEFGENDRIVIATELGL